MMVVLQNILSTIMLKYVQLLDENVKLHMAASEICQARNLCSTSRIDYLIKKKYRFNTFYTG